MKKTLLLGIYITLTSPVIAQTDVLQTNATYYMTFGGDIAHLCYLVIREAPNLYEKCVPYSQGFIEIGSWKQRGDTLFVIPKYKIKYDSTSPKIMFYDNYFEFRSSDEFMDRDYDFATSYIMRQNGLFEERLLTTPWMPDFIKSFYREVDPLNEVPLYFKILPKGKHTQRYPKRRWEIIGTRLYIGEQHLGESRKQITFSYMSSFYGVSDFYSLHHPQDSSIISGIWFIEKDHIYMIPKYKFSQRGDSILIQQDSLNNQDWSQQLSFKIKKKKLVNIETNDLFYKLDARLPYPNRYSYGPANPNPRSDAIFKRKLIREFKQDQLKKRK